MADFVMREWRLEPSDGDQAPLHVHHSGDEAFVCISGDLDVLVGDTRRSVAVGEFVLVQRGTVHTLATRGGVQVLAVMSPEIGELINGLNAAHSGAERAALWERCRSSLV